ncbi:MAG: ExbD/TolR family protein [bacterium]
MAGADVGGGQVTKGGRRRISIHIDMTPMVDVIILLLIFFFMTSQFKEPHGIEITLPKTDIPVKIPQSNTVTLKVDAENNVFINDEPVEKIEKIREFLIQRQTANPDTVTILDVDPKATYKTMIDVLDEFQIASDETGVTKFSLALKKETTEGGTGGGG